MSGIQVVIVTPEQTVLDCKAEFAALPLVDGEIGILPGHAATIGRLGFGELRVRDGSKTNHFFVEGGFTQIANNVVSVLTNRAMPVTELDKAKITERLAAEEAKSGLTGEEAFQRRQAIDHARAQLRALEKV